MHGEFRSATLHLPGSMRDELRNPLGALLPSLTVASLRAAAGDRRVCAVGDRVVFTLDEMGRPPQVAVVDYRTRREDAGPLRERVSRVGDSVLRCKNPAGAILPELWDSLEKAYSVFHTPHPASRCVRVEVDGEEDLAALPAILLAPDGWAVLYGLPDRGVVVVPAEEEKRLLVRRILSRFTGVAGWNSKS